MRRGTTEAVERPSTVTDRRLAETGRLPQSFVPGWEFRPAERGAPPGRAASIAGAHALKRNALARPPMVEPTTMLRILQATAPPLYKLWWRSEVHGSERLPQSGPVILAGTHRSHLDSIILPSVTRRPVNFMAKEECFESEWGARFFANMAVFPVSRGASDRAALRRALDVLHAGAVLGIYPEGTRRSGRDLGGIQRGTAWLAARAQAPIFPVGLGGTESVMSSRHRWPRPKKVRLVVGDPIAPPATTRKGDLVRATEELRERLQGVFDEAGGPGPVRGGYAGRIPELSSRAGAPPRSGRPGG